MKKVILATVLAGLSSANAFADLILIDCKSSNPKFKHVVLENNDDFSQSGKTQIYDGDGDVFGWFLVVNKKAIKGATVEVKKNDKQGVTGFVVTKSLQQNPRLPGQELNFEITGEDSANLSVYSTGGFVGRLLVEKNIPCEVSVD